MRFSLFTHGFCLLLIEVYFLCWAGSCCACVVGCGLLSGRRVLLEFTRLLLVDVCVHLFAILGACFYSFGLALVVYEYGEVGLMFGCFMW